MLALVGIDDKRIESAHIDAQTRDVFDFGIDRERHISVNGQQQIRRAALVGEFFAEIFLGEKDRVAFHEFDRRQGRFRFYYFGNGFERVVDA